MKPLFLSIRVLFLVAGFVAAVQAAEPTGPGSPGTPAGNVLVPEGVAPAEVQKAILLAGTGRGWMVRSKEDGEVVLFLEQGGWRSTLTLSYDAREVRIFSNSAKLNRKGVPKKYAIPENWVKFLKQDITKHLGTAAFGA